MLQLCVSTVLLTVKFVSFSLFLLFTCHLCSLVNVVQIGGGNLYNKAVALHYLASRCDGLFFVGMMSFQIMHALGLSVPSSLVEKDAHKAALDLIQFAHHKNINIIYPKDFWCINSHLPNHLEMFPAHFIPDGKFDLIDIDFSFILNK